MRAERQIVGDRLGREHRADRKAAAEALGRGQDVRRDAQPHVGVKLSGAAHAGLHFVVDQQRVVLVAQLACGAREFGGRRQYAALALQRLHHHGAGLVRDRRFERGDIVERQVRDTSRNRLEALGVLGLAADADGEQRASVKGVVERDDLVLALGARIAVATCQLERGFVGLAPGVGEKHALGESLFGQLARQAQRRFVGDHVREVPELVALLGQRGHQLRVAVTQHGHRNAAGEVDVFLVVLIPDSRTLASHRHDGARNVIRNHDFIEGAAGYGSAGGTHLQ